MLVFFCPLRSKTGDWYISRQKLGQARTPCMHLEAYGMSQKSNSPQNAPMMVRFADCESGQYSDQS